MQAPASVPACWRRIAFLLCAVLIGAPLRAAELPLLHSHAGDASVRVPLVIVAVDDAWRAALPRDAKLATQAYLDRLPKEAVQRSNDYDEGGYWLQLWEVLIVLAIAGLLLQGRRSARLRDWAQRVGRYALLRDGLYGGVYGLVTGLLMLPLNFYRGYWREHGYGMSTQDQADWWLDWAVGLGVEVVGTMLAVALLYAVFRRAGERWWLWGGGRLLGLAGLDAARQPGADRPAVQHLQAAGTGPRAECRVDDGACHRRTGRRGLCLRRLAPDQARQRQRQRLGEHGGDPPQRQPLEPHLAARDSRGDGP